MENIIVPDKQIIHVFFRDIFVSNTMYMCVCIYVYNSDVKKMCKIKMSE